MSSKHCNACDQRHPDSAACSETAAASSLVEAMTLVNKFFEGDDAKTALWFTSKNPNFGEATPIELFKRERGHKVLAWIKVTLEENKQ